MRLRLIPVAVAAALLAAPSAAAHITLNPPEWEAGGFARFALRVPNERSNGSTTQVRVQFPESVISASFQDVPGWERKVQMAPLDEPIEEDGEEPITERIATVTWSGGKIEPGEFEEFGVSFQVPEDATGPLLFPAIQTYSDGDIVRWIAPDEEADTPAPRVDVVPAGQDQAAASTGTTETTAGEDTEATGSAGGSDDDDGRANLALGLGIAGLVAGLVALAVSLLRSPRRREPVPAE